MRKWTVAALAAVSVVALGVGSLAHIAGEIFNRAAKAKSVHIPFKIIGDAITETMADRVHFLLFTVPSASPIVRELGETGKVEGHCRPPIARPAPRSGSSRWWPGSGRN